MFTPKALLSPVLPQSGSNGIITSTELTGGTVDVLVPAYSNMAVGDSIRVYFDSLASAYRTVKESDLMSPTMLFEFQESIIPDGVYNVYYTATDWVGNASQSPNTSVIVSRNGNYILPEPVFLDAINSVITANSVIENNGTNLKIPLYQGIREGDYVTVNTNVIDSASQPVSGGTYIVTHIVTAQETVSGFSVLVPSSKILVPDGNMIKASYRVVRALTGDVDFSATATATLYGNVAYLPAPYFPDAVSGWLSFYAVATGIRIRVPVYPGASSGDTVNLQWYGYDRSNVSVADANGEINYTLTSPDVSNSYIEFVAPRSVAVNINFGRIDAFYKVADQGGERLSYVGSANIDMQHQTLLPAPVFTQDINGSVESNVIEKENGLILSIRYSGMVNEDILVVEIDGRDAAGLSVENASYTASCTITPDIIQSGFVLVVIPATVALSVGDEGVISAMYHVIHSINNGISLSEGAATMVKINKDVNDPMEVYCTTGAPVFDYNSIRVRPYNIGFVKAPPGTSVTAYCSSPAVFENTESTEHTFTVGISGYYSLKIKSPITGAFTVIAMDNDNNHPMASSATVFSPYKVGSGKFKALAYTTGSRADGVSPCSIYAVTDNESDSLPEALTDEIKRPITYVNVAVNGSASVYGYNSQSANVSLNSDNSVEIQIVDNIAENVTVTLSLPESSGSVQTFSLNFRGF